MPLRTTLLLNNNAEINPAFIEAPETPEHAEEPVLLPGMTLTGAEQNNTYARNRVRKSLYHTPDTGAPIQPPKQVYGESLTAKQRAGIRDSFTTDNPLSCIEDERARVRIENVLAGELPEDADRQRKAIALAHYYSMGHREETSFIFSNIEAAIEKFEGKKMSVEQAYKSIQDIYQPPTDTSIFDNSYVSAFLHGEAKIANTVFDVGAFLGKVFGYMGNYQARAKMMELGLPELAEEMPAPTETARAVESAVRKLQDKGEYKDLEAFFAEKTQMPEDWATNSGSLGAWIKNASIALVDFTPQLAAQTGVAILGGPAAVGGVFGISGYYEAKEEHGMGDAKALLYGACIGLINGALEKVSLGILEGKITKKAAKEGIKQGLGGFLKHYGISLAMEGAEEGLEEIAENVLDMAMGVTDTTNFTAQDYAKALFRGVPEAAILGAATSGVFATPSYFNLRERADANEKTRALVSARIKELNAKETLTDTEEKQLAALNVIQDAGNMEEAQKAAVVIQREAEIRRAAEQRKEAEAEAELTDDERNEREAEITIDLRTQARLTKYDVRDTADTVAAFAQQFPAFTIETVRTARDLPEQVQKQQQERGISLNKIDAAWDGENKVYIVGDKVRPSEAEKKVLHEIVGHAGLQAVFGERFDSFLDVVYNERAAEIEAGKYAERYNTAPDTKEAQRYLAEEFLADMAERDVKPAWWKEFISSIKAYLRQIFPKIHYTDADIEHELMRSARATRRKNGKTPAPRAARFSLDEVETANINTPAFKDWFKDSKIVDKDGKPLVVYHDTNAKIYVNRETGENWDVLDWKERDKWENRDDWDEFWEEQDFYSFSTARARRSIEYPGFFFTPTADPNHEYGERRIAAFLSIQNPAINPKIEDAGVYDNSGEVAMKKLIEQGYDGIIRTDEDGNVEEYIAFYPEQIKSVDNAGTFDPNNKDIRFSVEDYSEKDKRDFITIMKPKYAAAAFVEPAEAKAYLESIGEKDISEADAWSFYQLAGMELKDEKRRRNEKRRDEWLYQNNQLWRDVVDFIGNGEVIIRPAYRFEGTDFTGTFISPEWRQYSIKRPQGDKESDTSYSKYKKKREAALANAKGVHSDVLAEAIARKYGRDSLEVENELMEYFADLTKPKLYSQYHKFQAEENYRNKQAETEAREEYEAYRRGEIEDAVVDLISRGEPITQEYAEANMDVFNELYRQLLKEEPPKSATPSKLNLETVNEALTHEKGRAEGFAAAYKRARETGWKAYQKALSDLKFEAMKNKADAAMLQRQALKFAEENLPEDQRGEFTRGILRLLDYSTSPSQKYPEGRRLHEFRKLLESITEASQEARKESSLAKIKDMLDSAKMKRNWKGIPISIAPSEQGNIDRVRKIVDMNPAIVANSLDYNNERIKAIEDALEEDVPEDTRATLKAELEQHIKDNMLLDTFGNLNLKKPDALKQAEEALRKMIRHGKFDFEVRLGQRFAEAENMRLRAIDDATFGKRDYQSKTDAKAHLPYMMKLSSLPNLLRLVSGKSIQDFDSSIGGELAREIEDSTQAEQTAMRRLQEDFDAELVKDAGATGNTLAFMLKKGRIIRELKKEVEHSGVFKREYARTLKVDNEEITERGRRSTKKREIPIEDYTYQGKTMQGARSLLRAIDNGETTDIYLDETAIWFLRKQLEDYDAGIKRSYEMFTDEGDQEAAKKLQEETGKDTVWILEDKDPQYTEVEVPLSQGTALQILFTWEQEDYRPNMKWNGWTEESIAQLRKFIKPETLKLGKWMRDYIARKEADLDAAVYERYGAHLPKKENYWPGIFNGDRSEESGALARGAGSMSINPSFLIGRKFHLDPPDLNANAFSIFLDNQNAQAHFIAWHDTVRKLREVYGNAKVIEAINANFGKDVSKEIQEHISAYARGGQAITSMKYLNTLFSKAYRYWIPSKIAMNVSSIIKQVQGILAYVNNMPLIPFIRGLATANFTNPRFREYVKWLKETDYFKNRMSGGLDKDLLYLLNNTRDSQQYSAMLDALLSASTWFTKKADAWSVIHGGYAVYEYTRQQAKKRGLSDAEAHEAARREMMRATDETQQSGYLKDLNYFQQNQGLIRYLTAFRSNPIQVLNLELRTLRELKYGQDKAAAGKKLARQIFINHIVMPTMMQFVTDMMKYGLDTFDEAEIEDYLLAWLFGPFESATIWPQLIYSSSNALLDMAVRGKSAPQSAADAFPMVTDAYRDARGTFKLFDEEVTPEEVMDSLKFAGDIGMLIGGAYAPAGNIGAVTNSIGTQGKRAFRLFGKEEKKKK